MVEADGPEKLTMRRLAVELDTAPASLYGVDALLQQATAMAAEFGGRDAGYGDALAEFTAQLEAADHERHPALLRLGAGLLAGGDPLARRDWALDAPIAGITTAPRADE